MMYLACDGLIELLISLVHVDLALATDAEARDAVHSYRELPADLFLGLGFRNHLRIFYTFTTFPFYLFTFSNIMMAFIP